MRELFRIDRIGTTMAAAATMLLLARTSEADKGRCSAARSAVDSAHASERAGNLGDSLESYRSCAAQTDCAWLASKCAAKITTVEAKLPSILIVANDETGEPVADVEVRVDGVLRASKLQGTALALAPGLHELSLTGGGHSGAQRVMILEGQRNQIVTVALRPKSPAATSKATAETAASSPGRKPVQPSSGATESSSVAAAAARQDQSSSGTQAEASSGSEGDAVGADAARVETAVESTSPRRMRWVLPRSPLPYTIAAVGLTGVAAGILTTVWGNKDTTTLQNHCAPNCSPSSQTHIKMLYTIADVSYGVGIAALGVATWMFASSRGEEKVPSAATIVDVHPVPSGALASISGSF